MTAEPRSVLAIDTATDGPGVALLHEGRTRVQPIGWRASFRDAAPAALALLRSAGLGWDELDALAVPTGPGSFTGLRVGAALAVGLARGRGTALHGVPTLEAIAESYAPDGAARVCAALDARRGRWYVGLLERGDAGWRTLRGPADLRPEEVAELAGELPIVGPVAEGEPRYPAPVAAGIAALVRLDPARSRVPSAGELELIYARSGVE